MDIYKIKNVANDISNMWIGFCLGWLLFSPTTSFWKIFSFEIVGVILIWVIGVLVAILFGNKEQIDNISSDKEDKR